MSLWRFHYRCLNFKSENISLLLNNGSSDKSVQPKVSLNQQECYFKHSFDKTGIYDVHIKVDDAIIATYVVKVKRK